MNTEYTDADREADRENGRALAGMLGDLHTALNPEEGDRLSLATPQQKTSSDITQVASHVRQLVEQLHDRAIIDDSFTRTLCHYPDQNATLVVQTNNALLTISYLVEGEDVFHCVPTDAGRVIRLIDFEKRSVFEFASTGYGDWSAKLEPTKEITHKGDDPWAIGLVHNKLEEIKNLLSAETTQSTV